MSTINVRLATTAERVREVFVETLGDPRLADLSVDKKVVDLYREGYVDSLAVVELILALEEAFEIDIPDEDGAVFESIEKPKTFGDVIAYVESRVARPQ